MRVDVNVEFSPGIVQRSVSVPIVDDSIVEGTELFFALLSDAGDPVVINPEEATVFIQDEGDSKFNLRYIHIQLLSLHKGRPLGLSLSCVLRSVRHVRVRVLYIKNEGVCESRPRF